LRYIGWVLSDPVSSVRLASVKALGSLYAKKDFAVSLSHFTDRFKSRLVEMATRDIDLAIRVATIGVLSNIEELEENEKNKICLMIFDEEPKLRKAASPFVQTIWEEAVEERIVGHVRDEATTQRVGIKCFAELLVKLSRALEKEQEDMETSSQSQIDSWQQSKEVSWLVQSGDGGVVGEGRTSKVVDALAENIQVLRDWKPLLEDLLLDHSAVSGSAPGTKKGRKGKNVVAVEAAVMVEDYWRLDDAEEGVMLEVLLAVLQKAAGNVAGVTGKRVRHSFRITR
jgi:cohesin complex subunit SA-1/2